MSRKILKHTLTLLLVLTLAATFFAGCSFDLSQLLGGEDPQTEVTLPNQIEIIYPTFEFNDATENADYAYMEYASPLFADSDQRYLNADDLESLSAAQLLLARSEIYARHGVKFMNMDLADYFEHQSWYTPAVAEDAFDEAALNDHESANIQLIEVYENILKGVYAPAADNPYMPYYNPSTELIMPESSTETLTNMALSNYNEVQLVIIRNQIIALHGYTFGDPELLAYFLQCSWYRPSTAPGRSDLVQGMTSVEYANMELIYQYEQNPQSQTPIQTSPNKDNLDTELTYRLSNDFFSVSVPTYFQEYAVIEQGNRQNNLPMIRFSEKFAYEAFHGGHLFTICIDVADDEPPYPNYTDLGVFTDGVNYFRLIALYPSDIQFADSYREWYSSMTGEASRILKTIELAPGYEFVDENA